MTTIPPFLKKGDVVELVAPAGFIDKKQLLCFFEVMEEWGLKINIGKHTFSRFKNFSDTDENRLSDFQNAINNKNSKAIMCARGGYGAIRILDKINWNNFKKNPKWLIGFSDVTVLHSYINNKLNIASIHGPMAVSFTKLLKEKKSLIYLKNLIFGESLKYVITNKIKNINISGKIVGGNLSILYSLRGTKYDIDLKDKILFIEDTGEYMYHIDRMLQNLRFHRDFQKLKAIIVGTFSEIKENDILFAFTLTEILKQITNNKVPIINNFKAGHSIPNFPLIFGKEIKIKSNENKVFIEQN